MVPAHFDSHQAPVTEVTASVWSGKSGLPVSASWIIIPMMPIIAARPLLRSALSLNSRIFGSE